MSLAFINLRACSNAALRFFSVVASACCAASFIGLGTIATDLPADSINDDSALSAWATLFTAKSRTCGGASISFLDLTCRSLPSGSLQRTILRAMRPVERGSQGNDLINERSWCRDLAVAAFSARFERDGDYDSSAVLKSLRDQPCQLSRWDT
jgi:hypothetical protein